MYSLYRAWLMRDAVATGLATPPDVIIQVGTEQEQFLAHRSLIALHSGYLKSLLYDSSAAAITVPNVMPDAFGPLLTFMYTGHLHLDSENIYSILLATHLLHMPRALELCREFLMQQPQPSPPLPPPNIIKPIPSRQAVVSTPSVWIPNVLQSSLLLRPNPDGPFQSVATAQPEYSTGPLATPEANVSTTTANSSASSSPTFTLLKNGRKMKKINDENKETVIDVACCDGPVQFYRVLNESYKCSNNSDDDDNDDDDDNYNLSEARSERPKDEQEETTDVRNPHLHSNNLQQLRRALEKNVNAEDTSESFICIYCKHTFKSHFCYEKHVRRHLNHVDKVKISENSRRQVRLLDMNVQYYPCKTCGSKFPSYYFVHKHRKLCHLGDGNEQTAPVEKEHGEPPNFNETH